MERVERRVRVRVDPNRCVGSTICVQVTPGVFGLDDKRQSTVTDPDGMVIQINEHAAPPVT